MFTNLAFLIGKSKVVLRTTRGDDGSFVDDKIPIPRKFSTLRPILDSGINFNFVDILEISAYDVSCSDYLHIFTRMKTQS